MRPVTLRFHIEKGREPAKHAKHTKAMSFSPACRQAGMFRVFGGPKFFLGEDLGPGFRLAALGLRR
jgi:hypothetical protein